MALHTPGIAWLRSHGTFTKDDVTVETDGTVTLNQILEGDRLYVLADGQWRPYEVVGYADKIIELRTPFDGDSGVYDFAIDRNPVTRSGAKTLRDMAKILTTVEEQDILVEEVEEARDVAVAARQGAENLYGNLQAVEQAKTDAQNAAGDAEGSADKARDDAILTAQLVGQAQTHADDAAASAAVASDYLATAYVEYESVEEGLSNTSPSEFFSVPIAGDEGLFILYRNDDGSAVEVARYPSARAAAPMTIDRRIDDYHQRTDFATASVEGAYTTDGTQDPSAAWSVEGGALHISGHPSSGNPRIWRTGRRWNGKFPLEIIARGKKTTDDSAFGLGIYLGDFDTAAAHFIYHQNGAVGIVDYSGSSDAGRGGIWTGQEDMAYNVDEEVELRVVVRPDGTGFVEATNPSGGKKWRYIHDVPVYGDIGLSCRGADHLEIEYFDVRNGRNLSTDIVRSARDRANIEKLLWPQGFSENETEGWFRASTGAYSPRPTWSINDDGHLVVDGDAPTDNGYWDVGRSWTGEQALEVVIEGEFSDFKGRNTGLAVYLGDVERYIYFLYARNGAIGVFDGSASEGQGGAVILSHMTFSENEKVRMRVVVRPDGTGFVEATNPSGIIAVHDVHDITERGRVAPYWWRKPAGVITRFSVERVNAYVADRLEFVGGQAAAASSAVTTLDQRVEALELAEASSYNESVVLVEPPVGFTFRDYGFQIVRGLQSKSFSALFDPETKQIDTSLDLYVDPATGDDSNDGTEGSPLATVAAAVTAMNDAAVPTTIFLSAGEYSYEDVGDIPVVQQDFNLICPEEMPAVLTLSSIETGWEPDPTHTNLWKKSVSGPGPVWAIDNSHVDEFGEGRPLTIFGSLAAANAEPGSMHVDGATIYVRLFDDREPDGSVRVVRDRSGWDVATSAWYWRNVHHLGASNSIFTAGNRTDQHSCFDRCRLSYARSGNVVSVKRSRGGTIFVYKSTASWSRSLDGWNWHKGAGAPCCDVVEIDVVGHHNGLAIAGNNNGSTMHDGGRIIRVNGCYTHNGDRNVHDVTTGTEVWCLGSIAGDAQNDRTDPYDNACFLFGRKGQSDGTKAWLDSCISYGSAGDFGVYGNSVLKVRNTDVSEGNFKVVDTDGSAVLEPY